MIQIYQFGKENASSPKKPGRILLFERAWAIAVGKTAAIFLNRLSFWLGRSKNIIDGVAWVYNSYDDWGRDIGVSAKTVQRLAGMLKALGLIRTEKKNAKQGDHRLWYTLAIDPSQCNVMAIADAVKRWKQSQKAANPCSARSGHFGQVGMDEMTRSFSKEIDSVRSNSFPEEEKESAALQNSAIEIEQEAFVGTMTSSSVCTGSTTDSKTRDGVDSSAAVIDPKKINWSQFDLAIAAAQPALAAFFDWVLRSKLPGLKRQPSSPRSAAQGWVRKHGFVLWQEYQEWIHRRALEAQKVPTPQAVESPLGRTPQQSLEHYLRLWQNTPRLRSQITHLIQSVPQLGLRLDDEGMPAIAAP